MEMKKINLPVALAALFLYLNSFSQTPDPFVQNVINQTNLDSLVSYVRILSGEDSVTIRGNRVLITNRTSSTVQQDLAADYIKMKLRGFRLDVLDWYFGTNGRNVYAVQPGLVNTSEKYIVCAHYDGVTSYCADDNASGTAAVIEVARILSQYQLENTVAYALWDEEELGLIGSRNYAQQASASGEQIAGVINLDMIGWDGNNDGLMDIHTRNVGQSAALANFGDSLNTLYNLGLAPVIYNPGTTASDHASFWTEGFTAIGYSESYYGGDFNPYYHSSSDRISRFNLTYFHNISKLVSATMAALAGEYVPTLVDIEEQVALSYDLKQNYPNPFNNSTRIEYTVQSPAEIELAVYNSLGEKMLTLKQGYHTPGNYHVLLNADQFPSGIYYYVLSGKDMTLSRKMILIR